MTATTDLIDTYFARAAGLDDDDYLDLFADEAVVEDEGHSHRGADAIRTWRAITVPVRYDVLDITSDQNGTAAQVRISGEFDGSPVVLVFQFGVDGNGRILKLRIAPAVSS